MPITVLAFGAPVWVGLLAAVAVMAAVLPLGGYIRVRTTPARLRPALETALADALPALRSLEATAPKIAAPAMRSEATAIVAAAKSILADVAAEPARLASVQRLLTYYLPSAASLFAAYQNLAETGLDPERRERIEVLAPRLSEVFRRVGDARREADLRLVDTEIRLLDSALRDDLGG